MSMCFTYDKKALTTQTQLLVSVADVRDLVQAITIPQEGQRLQELQLVLDCIARKNCLRPGALHVE